MQTAPLPDNELQRLEALRHYGILDTAPESEFDDITEVASRAFGVPISLLSLVDEDRQWFKSKQGIAASETSRDIAFCSHAILDDAIFVVEDARADERFADNPLVENTPNIRFYAGAPVTVGDNFRLGTLCIIDTVPRSLDSDRLKLLAILRDAVVAKLELRHLHERTDPIISLCAWCRRIRRAEDDGWEEADEFLRSRFAVSHAICPECREVALNDA